MPAPDSSKRKAVGLPSTVPPLQILEEAAQFQISPDKAGQVSGGIQYQGQAFQANVSTQWKDVAALFGAGVSVAQGVQKINQDFDRKQRSDLQAELETMKKDNTKDDTDIMVWAKGLSSDPEVGGNVRSGNAEWLTGFQNEATGRGMAQKYKDDLLEFNQLGPDMSITDRIAWVTKVVSTLPERFKGDWNETLAGLTQQEQQRNLSLRQSAAIRHIYGGPLKGLFSNNPQEQEEWVKNNSRPPTYEMDGDKVKTDEDGNPIILEPGGPFPGLDEMLNDPQFNLEEYVYQHVQEQVHAWATGAPNVNAEGGALFNVEKFAGQTNALSQWTSESLRSIIKRRKALSDIRTQEVATVSGTNANIDSYTNHVELLYDTASGNNGDATENQNFTFNQLDTTQVSIIEGMTDAQWITYGSERKIPAPNSALGRLQSATSLVNEGYNAFIDRGNYWNPELDDAENLALRRNAPVDRLGAEWDDDLEVSYEVVDPDDDTKKITKTTKGGWKMGDLMSARYTQALMTAQTAAVEDFLGDFGVDVTEKAMNGQWEEVAKLLETVTPLAWNQVWEDVDPEKVELIRAALFEAKTTTDTLYATGLAGHETNDLIRQMVVQAGALLGTEEAKNAMDAAIRLQLKDKALESIKDAEAAGDKNRARALQEAYAAADNQISPQIDLLSGIIRYATTEGDKKQTAESDAMTDYLNGKYSAHNDIYWGVPQGEEVRGSVAGRMQAGMSSDLSILQQLNSGAYFPTPDTGMSAEAVGNAWANSRMIYQNRLESGRPWHSGPDNPDGSNTSPLVTMADIEPVPPTQAALAANPDALPTGIFVQDSIVMSQWRTGQVVPAKVREGLSSPMQDIWLTDTMRTGNEVHSVARGHQPLADSNPFREGFAMSAALNTLESRTGTGGFNHAQRSKLMAGTVNRVEEAVILLQNRIEMGIDTPEDVNAIRPAMAVLYAVAKADSTVSAEITKKVQGRHPNSWTAYGLNHLTDIIATRETLADMVSMDDSSVVESMQHASVGFLSTMNLLTTHSSGPKDPAMAGSPGSRSGVVDIVTSHGAFVTHSYTTARTEGMHGNITADLIDGSSTGYIDNKNDGERIPNLPATRMGTGIAGIWGNLPPDGRGNDPYIMITHEADSGYSKGEVVWDPLQNRYRNVGEIHGGAVIRTLNPTWAVNMIVANDPSFKLGGAYVDHGSGIARIDPVKFLRGQTQDNSRVYEDADIWNIYCVQHLIPSQSQADRLRANFEAADITKRVAPNENAYQGVRGIHNAISNARRYYPGEVSVISTAAFGTDLSNRMVIGGFDEEKDVYGRPTGTTIVTEAGSLGGAGVKPRHQFERDWIPNRKNQWSSDDDIAYVGRLGGQIFIQRNAHWNLELNMATVPQVGYDQYWHRRGKFIREGDTLGGTIHDITFHDYQNPVSMTRNYLELYPDRIDLIEELEVLERDEGLGANLLGGYMAEGELNRLRGRGGPDDPDSYYMDYGGGSPGVYETGRVTQKGKPILDVLTPTQQIGWMSQGAPYYGDTLNGFLLQDMFGDTLPTNATSAQRVMFTDATRAFDGVFQVVNTYSRGGRRKSTGWKGPIILPNGDTMTEMSINMEVGYNDPDTGKYTILPDKEIPSIVPTLTDAEVEYLALGGDILSNDKTAEEIRHKAVNFAAAQLEDGESVWAGGIATLTLTPEQEMHMAYLEQLVATNDAEIQAVIPDFINNRYTETYNAAIAGGDDHASAVLAATASREMAIPPSLIAELNLEVRNRTIGLLEAPTFSDWLPSDNTHRSYRSPTQSTLAAALAWNRFALSISPNFDRENRQGTSDFGGSPSLDAMWESGVPMRMRDIEIDVDFSALDPHLVREPDPRARPRYKFTYGQEQHLHTASLSMASWHLQPEHWGVTAIGTTRPFYGEVLQTYPTFRSEQSGTLIQQAGGP